MSVRKSRFVAVRVVSGAALALTAFLALTSPGSAGEMTDLPAGTTGVSIDVEWPPPIDLDFDPTAIFFEPPKIVFIDKACTVEPQTDRQVVSAYITDPDSHPEDLIVWIDGHTPVEPRVPAPMTYMGETHPGSFHFTFDATEFGGYTYGWIEVTDPHGGFDSEVWNCDEELGL